MCMTVNKAALSATKILSIKLDNGNHFIAYSNKAKNTSGEPNAMILAIPGTTKPEWFHNTEKYRGFLDEITEKARWQEDWNGIRSRGMKGKSLHKEFQLGMYTIGLADSFDGAEAFINSLPKEKKPQVSEGLRNFLREKYDGWSFAVCCFDSNETIDAQPIAFEYTPFNPDLIYFPTLDAHDGDAPNLLKKVDADHTFIYEHTGKFENEVETDSFGRCSPKYQMKYVRLGANVPDFLNNRRYRLSLAEGPIQNGDTYIVRSELQMLDFSKHADLFRMAPVPQKPFAAL